MVALALLMVPSPVSGLEVYDCETEKTTYEVIDLLATKECQHQQGRYQLPREQWAQILHVEPTQSIKGQQC